IIEDSVAARRRRAFRLATRREKRSPAIGENGKAGDNAGTRSSAPGSRGFSGSVECRGTVPPNGGRELRRKTNGPIRPGPTHPFRLRRAHALPGCAGLGQNLFLAPGWRIGPKMGRAAGPTRRLKLRAHAPSASSQTIECWTGLILGGKERTCSPWSARRNGDRSRVVPDDPSCGPGCDRSLGPYFGKSYADGEVLRASRGLRHCAHNP